MVNDQVTDMRNSIRDGLPLAEFTLTAKGNPWLSHHTVTQTSADMGEVAERRHIEVIDEYHYEKRDFSMGIGYHAMAFPSGNGYLFDDADTQRAHIGSLNHKYNGVAFAGWHTDDRDGPPTDAALETTAAIILAHGGGYAGPHGAFSMNSTRCHGDWSSDLVLHAMTKVRETVEEVIAELTVPPHITTEDMLNAKFWHAVHDTILNNELVPKEIVEGEFLYELVLADWR